ncbi:hypothetical protein [Liquorilactobacillus uvarum]|nr:hypothetical protein [Liquorilactobacillus uvarum]
MITRKKFFFIFNKLLLSVFTVWLGIVLIGAIRNDHFFIGNISAMAVGLILLLIFLIVVYLKIPSVKMVFRSVFVRYAYITAPILLLLVIFWQLLILNQTHTRIGFDAGFIHNFLKNPHLSTSYLSTYPNNLFLLFFQKFLLSFFNMKLTWLNAAYLSLLCTDISVLLNLLTVRVINKKKVSLAVYIHCVFLFLFPMIIVPYSDTLVLPFVSACLFAFSCMVYLKNEIVRISASILLGGSIAGTYLMKPSSVIPIIAIVIVYGLYVCTLDKNKFLSKQMLMKMLLPTFCVLFFAGISVRSFNNYIEKQNFVHVQKGMALPPIHFISMGMIGKGGYNQEDVMRTLALKKPEARKKYSKKVMNERLKQMGPLGFIKFLLFKNYNNTSDGSFGWNVEGGFITAPVERGSKGFLQSFLYPTGKRLGDFYWFAQLSWSMLLLIIIFGYDHRTKYVQMLRLGILGGFLFLLIFEGGRSRYLIQFLPMYLILAVLVFDDAKGRIKKITTTLK